MLLKDVVRAQSPAPSVFWVWEYISSLFSNFYFFFYHFLLLLGISIWEWHLQCPGGCVCDSEGYKMRLINWKQTEAINWKLFAVEFCVAQKLSRAESWAQPLPFSEAENLFGPSQWWSWGVFCSLDWWRSLGGTEWPINDVFCSGRSWLLSHYPLSCGWHLSGQSGADGLFKLLSSCSAASLLFIWSLLRGSDKPLIKVAIETKPCFVDFSVSVLPSSPHYHILLGCAILLLQKDHSKTCIVWFFHYILLGFYSSLGETVFC